MADMGPMNPGQTDNITSRVRCKEGLDLAHEHMCPLNAGRDGLGIEGMMLG